MLLSEEQIQKINKECPYEQGVFYQPYGVPVHIKEHVIYCRYEISGYEGGSCWGEDEPHYYERDPPKDRMKVLDIVLEELCPKITYLQYREIERLIHDNTETKYEYYGNSEDYKIEYIILSELCKLLSKFEE